MHVDIITCFPELLQGPFSCSIVKRAVAKGKAIIRLHNLRDYTQAKHHKVDDKPYGGGPGMVLMVEPIVRCIEQLQREAPYDEIIYMAPDGALWSQPMANTLALKGRLLILCGHYKGIDERIRTHWITQEISIGNYVLSGGELAAAVVVDSLIRLIPGVLSNEASARTDSFQNGLVAPPTYSRPANFRGLRVPDVLLSGHQAHIDAWRHQQALERTQARRPELLTEQP